MSNRRNFLKSFGLMAASAPFLSFSSTAVNAKTPPQTSRNPQKAACDEDFWAWVQQSYTASPNIINLNNGGVCPQPKVVQEAFETYNRLCNEAPSYYMWKVLNEGRVSLRKRLAKLSGASEEEIAIVRNTTEALDNVIFGLDLQKGDEVVLSNYDYPNVFNAWEQRVLRDGIKIKWVKLDLPMDNDEAIVSAFKKAFTPRTKIVNITHMINWTGQILPSKKIADAAHAQGIDVMVDAAHSFAHVEHKISDLNCDYYGTSLHKWLCAPFGTGMLYIKKDKIKKIWPMYPSKEPQSGKITKYEHMGTRAYAAEMAIGHAINFHASIGASRKEARLRFLKDYWAEKVKDLDRVKFNTSLKPDYSCALFNISIDGVEPKDIVKKMFDEYRIHFISIEREKIKGCRITPNVYTRLNDLDRLVEGIHKIAMS